MEPQDEYLKTALRLPRDLHAEIQESAAAAGRSMNAEIVQRLNDSFGKSSMSASQLIRLVLDTADYSYAEGASALADKVLPALKEVRGLVRDVDVSLKLGEAIQRLEGAIREYVSESSLSADFVKLLREERRAKPRG